MEIKHGAAKQVMKIERIAQSKGERPSVEIAINGPMDASVAVEFSHLYDREFKHKLAGKEGGKLESQSGDYQLIELKYGVWQLVTPPVERVIKLTFSTTGFSARHDFNVVVGDTEPLNFCLEIDYTAYRFVEIPYNGTDYTGYGREDAIWGLPELKTFIEKFAKLQHDETKVKPQIGNKAIKDGVKYKPHNGVSHPRGYAVDIRIRPKCTSLNIESEDYSKKEHIKQIERYFKCGANYVATSSKTVVAHFMEKGKLVEELPKHDKHDHVNVGI